MFMKFYVYQVIMVIVRLGIGVSFVAVSGILIGARRSSLPNNIDDYILFLRSLCS